MLSETDAIVLRYVNYRDHDRMLTLLTPRDGIISVLSRGCRRPKSPLMPASEWLVCGRFELVEAHGHKMLSACTIQDGFYPLREDLNRLNMAACMAGVCEKLAQKGQEESALYMLLMKGLYFLAYDGKCDALATTAAFLMKTVDLSGWRPKLKYCVHCGKLLDLSCGAVLDMDAGGLICAQCRVRGESALLTREDIVWMCKVLRNGYTAQESGEEMNRKFSFLRAYLEIRLEETVTAAHIIC